MKKLSILLIASILLVSCKKKNELPYSGEEGNNLGKAKKVKIEVDFGGDYKNYTLKFSTTGLQNDQTGFVKPSITTPQNVQWTEENSHTKVHTYEANSIPNKLVVESKEPINHIGFLLSPSLADHINDESAKPITAILKVYADGKLIESYDYLAKPNEGSAPLLWKTLNIGEYK